MIKIICIGKIKEKYFIDAINEYCKRLQKYTKLKISELPDEGLVEKTKAINIEGENILKHLDSKDYIISMDIAGKQMNSIEFAKKIDGISQFNSNITFIILKNFFWIVKVIQAISKLSRFIHYCVLME